MPDTFQQQEIPFGIQGLDLKRAIDLIPVTKLSRMTNVVRTEEGSLTGRAGLTAFITAAPVPHHSITRLNPRVLISGSGSPAPPIYILGAGTSLYTAALAGGAASLASTNFSGNPLTFATYHPPISGDSWTYIGDSVKMGKVRGSDALFLPIGLAPGSVVNTALAAQLKTTIDNCDAAGWTNNTGTGGGAPTNATDAAIKKEGTGSLKLTTNGVAGAFYNFWAKAPAGGGVLDLSTLPGATPATDDDLIHLWLRTDRPDLLVEFRIYFVVSTPFDTATVPGVDAAKNTDAFMKVFRASDFTPTFELTQSALAQSSTVNTNFDAITGLPIVVDPRPAVQTLARAYDQSRSASSQVGPGRGTWTEFGVLGLPLHRRDFRRLGTDNTRDWNTVTGIVLVAQSSTVVAVNIWLDDIYLTGGAGPDSSLLGLASYDYRFVNYDPRTGAKSNPSPIQPVSQMLDAVRQGIVVTPQQYGPPGSPDANIVQRIYRRGGTLPTQWLYVAANTSDGAPYTDNASDSSIAASVALELDNDQPVTTQQADGTTVYAQPLTSIWGPVLDILYGCGDPFRAGTLYWCKPTMLDSWPATFNVEACSPSEELMNGFVLGSAPFVFSRERLFAIFPNLSDAQQVTVQPTGCTHGLAGRWALAVGPGGCFFVAKDGIYLTSGGPEQSITENDIRGIFHGETRNGYLPVDFNFPNELRLAVHANELWFRYQDTSGGFSILIYSIVFQFWRAYTFATRISGMYSEEGTALRRLLLGGFGVGTTFTHAGTGDPTTNAITATIRTGSLDQGMPRENKLYGDFSLDLNRNGATVTVTPYINTEANSLAPTVISTGTGRQRYYGGLGATLARNVALDISWSTTGTSPIIYHGGVSWVQQPHTTETRVTNWDAQGALAAKLVKGIKLEVNTFGAAKQVSLQADGVTFTTISVNTPDRQVVEYAFPQALGRELRLLPADSVDWMLYQYRWIFDEEPQALTRWETQESTDGIDGWRTPVYAHVALKSTATVTLAITSYDQLGNATTNSYPLLSTGGVKQKLFVPLLAQKGILLKHVLTSSVAFYLYREETEVWVQVWGAGQLRVTHPFGNDDNSSPRAMRDSALTAARPNA